MSERSGVCHLSCRAAEKFSHGGWPALRHPWIRLKFKNIRQLFMASLIVMESTLHVADER
jgi:hypothetical protein